jgi:hypothetical protein
MDADGQVDITGEGQAVDPTGRRPGAGRRG